MMRHPKLGRLTGVLGSPPTVATRFIPSLQFGSNSRSCSNSGSDGIFGSDRPRIVTASRLPCRVEFHRLRIDQAAGRLGPERQGLPAGMHDRPVGRDVLVFADEYAEPSLRGQMRIFPAANERISKISDCVAERVEFELSGDFLNGQ